MNEPRNNVPEDLKALRYLDALNSGDMEAVAALWEEASSDARLEQLLSEIDATLFAEESAANCHTPENRSIEILPQPATQARKKPSSLLARQAHLISFALAAACVVIVLLQLRRNIKHSDPTRVPDPPVVQVTHGNAVDAAGIAKLIEARRDLEEGKMATFTWPLPETRPQKFSTSIPPDLLD